MTKKYFNITYAEAKQASATLFSAFTNDPMMQYVFGSEEQYLSIGQEVIETWINYCIRYGFALRTANFESIAIRKWPKDTSTSLWRIFRSGMFKLPKLMGKASFNRLMIMDELLNKLRKTNMEKKPFLYCWVLGTRKEDQNKGFGNILMQATFNKAKELNVPCYLETITEQAQKVHTHKGYKLLASEQIPDSEIIIKTMLRD